MGFLIGLLPALFWGFTPVLVSKLGGKPINQQLGTSFGCAVLALAVLIIFRARRHIGRSNWLPDLRPCLVGRPAVPVYLLYHPGHFKGLCPFHQH